MGHSTQSETDIYRKRRGLIGEGGRGRGEGKGEEGGGEGGGGEGGGKGGGGGRGRKGKTEELNANALF